MGRESDEGNGQDRAFEIECLGVQSRASMTGGDRERGSLCVVGAK